MTTEETESARIDDELGALREQLEGLRDLFKRRLLDDRTKQQAFDRLYAELEEAKRWRAQALLRPLLNEIVLLVDRIDSLLENEADEKLELVRSELLETLARRSVEPIQEARGAFDPAVHEVISTEPTDDPALDGHVLRVVRRGYGIDGTLLRPIGVVAATLIDTDGPAAQSDRDNEGGSDDPR